MTSRPSIEATIPAEIAHLFRKDSATRVVAERLLSGRRQTRNELVDGTGAAGTAVPRVVERLEKAGYKFDRSVTQNREALYQLAAPPASEPFVDPEHGEVLAEFGPTSGKIPVAVTKAEVVDGNIMLALAFAGTHYTARVVGTGAESLVIPTSLLTGNAEIVGVSVLRDGAVCFKVGDLRESVRLADLTARS